MVMAEVHTDYLGTLGLLLRSLLLQDVWVPGFVSYFFPYPNLGSYPTPSLTLVWVHIQPLPLP